jgi:hypothetical protein
LLFFLMRVPYQPDRAALAASELLSRVETGRDALGRASCIKLKYASYSASSLLVTDSSSSRRVLPSFRASAM